MLEHTMTTLTVLFNLILCHKDDYCLYSRIIEYTVLTSWFLLCCLEGN